MTNKSDWRLITKTSPPWDGQPVLVWHIAEGMWISSRRRGTSRNGMPTTGADWYLGARKWRPTHWRPLPEPPDWKKEYAQAS